MQGICMCMNGLIIDSILVNDLLVDCFPDPDDEFLLAYVLTGNANLNCSNPGELPCKEGHSKCFNISDICKYRLNTFGHLVPCRTGAHIQDCQNFECNVMFKCQDNYCIPWSYICDGK